jgi:hypothetical protein
MFLRSGKSIQGRGSQSITASICIEFLAQTPDVLRLAILYRQHPAEEEQAACLHCLNVCAKRVGSIGSIIPRSCSRRSALG